MEFNNTKSKCIAGFPNSQANKLKAQKKEQQENCQFEYKTW